MMFLACPACLDQYGAQRCGLPAEVKARYTLDSSDGPIEAAMISCPAGHHFNGPIESLTWDGNHRHELGPVGLGSRGGGASLRRGHVGPDGGGESALQEFHAGTRQKARRPNGAPAYYIGRPATMWITALRPRRTPAASRSLTEAAVRGDDPALASGVPQDS